MFFLCLLSIEISAQPVEYSLDFNKDGVADTLKYEKHYGSSKQVSYIDGASQKRYSFNKGANLADFLDFVSIPEALINQTALLDSVKKYMLGNLPASKSNPALWWLLEAYRSKKTTLNEHYTFTMHVKPHWYHWPPLFPEATYFLAHSDTLPLYESGQPGWLIYYGHNHRQLANGRFSSEFTKIDDSDSLELYQTSHGLLLRKDNQFRWMFHGNMSLTGGPDKLRRPSIQKAILYKNLIVLHHASPILENNNIFVINVTNGAIGKLKLTQDFSYNQPRNFNFRISGKNLLVSSKKDRYSAQAKQPEALTFKLSDLLKELEIN